MPDDMVAQDSDEFRAPPDVDIFHNVGRLFPDVTQISSVTPDTTLAEAVRTMLESRFSQLPVVEEGKVIGTLTVWSIFRELSRSPKIGFTDFSVEDCMESPLPFVTVEDGLDSTLGWLDKHEAVFVGSPDQIQAVASTWDVLRYFYDVASSYVLINEIELSLRALISICAPGEQLQRCIDHSLDRSSRARLGPIPTSVEEMSFDDYVSILSARENWPLFQEGVGGSRAIVRSRLDAVRRIRNNLFHAREVTILDHQDLVAARNWLLRRITRLRGNQGHRESTD